MPAINPQYDYDPKFDVLYVSFGDRSNSYGDDSEPGLIYLKDMDTEEVTGVTIMNFLHRGIESVVPKFLPQLRDLLFEIKRRLQM